MLEDLKRERTQLIHESTIPHLATNLTTKMLGICDGISGEKIAKF